MWLLCIRHYCASADSTSHGSCGAVVFTIETKSMALACGPVAKTPRSHCRGPLLREVRSPMLCGTAQKKQSECKWTHTVQPRGKEPAVFKPGKIWAQLMASLWWLSSGHVKPFLASGGLLPRKGVCTGWVSIQHYFSQWSLLWFCFVLFLITTLLRYNAHIIKITLSEIYSSVVCSIFTKLYNSCCCLIPEHLHHHKRNPHPLAVSSLPQPLATTDLLSTSVELPFLNIL